MHFAMTAEMEGPTKIQMWRMALEKLQERHPLLSVAIEQSDTGVPHFQTVRNALIPLRITPGPEVLSWQAEVVSELARPFDFRQSPLDASGADVCRARIAIHSDDASLDRGWTFVDVCNARCVHGLWMTRESLPQ